MASRKRESAGEKLAKLTRAEMLTWQLGKLSTGLGKCSPGSVSYVKAVTECGAIHEALADFRSDMVDADIGGMSSDERLEYLTQWAWKIPDEWVDELEAVVRVWLERTGRTFESRGGVHVISSAR